MAIYADVERGRYPVWQSLDHPNFFPGSGILFATITVCVTTTFLFGQLKLKAQQQGDFANRVEALTDAQVKSEVLTVLRSMFPGVDVPDPHDFLRPRWHSDPLFRGSYSNWPPSFSSQHLDNLRANIGRLYFAGEATSRKYFGSFLPRKISAPCDSQLLKGFLHGAYFEGLDMASLIANCLQGKPCRDLERFPKITNASPYELRR